MKRKWPYYLIALCIALLLAFAFRYWGRIFPSGYVSEVYSRYCEREDIRVEFLKDYRIDDSTVVDVTTLTAKDSASWESLLREMNVKDSMISKQRVAVREERSSIIEYYSLKGHPERRARIKECSDFDLVIHSFNERITYIFNVKTIEQGRYIQALKNNELLQ